MKIADAAARAGVAPHVLRHWEDVGVLRPARSPSGHRVYDEALVALARLVLVCQRAGFSLSEIAELHDAERAERAGLIAGKRRELAAVRADLDRADAFLAHVTQCRHPVVTECPDCMGFVRG